MKTPPTLLMTLTYPVKRGYTLLVDYERVRIWLASHLDPCINGEGRRQSSVYANVLMIFQILDV